MPIHISNIFEQSWRTGKGPSVTKKKTVELIQQINLNRLEQMDMYFYDDGLGVARSKNVIVVDRSKFVYNSSEP